jgi:chaperonin GroEL
MDYMLRDDIDLHGFKDDFILGYQYAQVSLKEPMKTIVFNAGVTFEIGEADRGIGYDALNDEWTDLLEAGVIDPVKVVKSAIKNACSVAGMLVTTECVITENKQ